MGFSEEIVPIEVFPARARAGDGVSAALDRYAYGRARTWLFLLSCGASGGTNPSMTISIEHTDNAAAGPWEVVSGGVFEAISTSGFAERTFRDTKRFVRVVVSESGGSPNFTYCVMAIAGDPMDMVI